MKTACCLRPPFRRGEGFEPDMKVFGGEIDDLLPDKKNIPRNSPQMMGVKRHEMGGPDAFVRPGSEIVLIGKPVIQLFRPSGFDRPKRRVHIIEGKECLGDTPR